MMHLGMQKGDRCMLNVHRLVSSFTKANLLKNGIFGCIELVNKPLILSMSVIDNVTQTLSLHDNVGWFPKEVLRPAGCFYFFAVVYALYVHC